jgi:branched-chain amino acid transport system ATP-binding protein
MSTLEVRGLTVRYGKLVAVDELDLDVQEGRIVVALGANGAGKTSSLNAICGALRPAAGSIRFEGREIAGRPAHKVARAGLVHVPEGRHIVATLTVEENLLLGAHVERSRARRNELLASVYELFPRLQERRSTGGALLSGGEQQMLAFGRALMSAPRMLLLDEPSMGLAPIMVNVVVGSVRSIAARGISILMVEQNAAAAFSVADEAYVLEQGRVIRSGPAAALASDPVVMSAFLGLDAPAAAQLDLQDTNHRLGIAT